MHTGRPLPPSTRQATPTRRVPGGEGQGQPEENDEGAGQLPVANDAGEAAGLGKTML
jgi:hypothetical protein